MEAVNEQIQGVVKTIGDIQSSMNNFATSEKVDALAKSFEQFANLKKSAERAERKHKLLGTQKHFDHVANIVVKGLVARGDVQPDQVSKWLDAAGAEKAADLNRTDASGAQGGTFLPVTIDPEINKLVEANGILRSYAKVRPNVHGTIQVKSRATRTTVNGMARPDTASPVGGSTYATGNLVTYQVGHITTVEEKLIWDSPVDLVNEAISDLAEAAAEFEDDMLFMGDGTAYYCGFTGLNTATTGIGGGSNESVAAASFGFDNLINLQTKVHTSVIRSGNAKYFMHPYVFAALQMKKASGTGNYFFDPSTNSFKVAGYEIVFAPRAGSTLVATKAPVIFGDLNKAVTVGLGRSYDIRVLTERYADLNEVGVRLSYDIGAVLVQPAAIAKAVLT